MNDINLIDIKNLFLDHDTDITIHRKAGLYSIEIFVDGDGYDEQGHIDNLDKINNIIGDNLISEFCTEQIGKHWFIYLMRYPIQFIDFKGYPMFSLTDLSNKSLKLPKLVI